jgi:uncharacterized protein YigA (DUF484 family)
MRKRTIVSRAQAEQWEYLSNHPEFSRRVVIPNDEMMFLVHLKQMDIDLTKWWKTKDKGWILIQAMDFSHLENTVDYFSRDGVSIDPERQAALENVILEYMKKKVDNERLVEKAMQLMENLDGQSKGNDDGATEQ